MPRDKCLVSPGALISFDFPLNFTEQQKQRLHSSIIIYLNYFRFVFAKFKENNSPAHEILVLTASVGSHGSDETVHIRSLVRSFAAHIFKIQKMMMECIKI